MGLKINIWKNKKLLENTPYYLKEDYPLEILNKRKELQEQLQKEKQLGNTAFISYDKLIVIKDKKEKLPRSHTNKRNLSISPELVQTNNTLKKNKITDFIPQRK